MDELCRGRGRRRERKEGRKREREKGRKRERETYIKQERDRLPLSVPLHIKKLLPQCAVVSHVCAFERYCKGTC